MVGTRSLSSGARSRDPLALPPYDFAMTAQFTALLTITSISFAPGRLKADDNTDFN
ncbi:hypothetical protein V1277_004017 [Bradyrhizobium sp. AZCC 1588]